MVLKQRLTVILYLAAFVLFIPFLAMQFTDDVQWGAFDFLVMGILLFGTGLAVELILRKVRKKEHRIALVVIILLGAILVWAELAVGVFGTPFAGS